MSKAVLISIRPEWCEKIAHGEKTIEMRRTKPRLEPPFKCYIYRTKGKVPHIIGGKLVKMPVGGSIIGEFVCDEIKKLIHVGCGAVEPPRYKATEVSGCSLEIYEWKLPRTFDAMDCPRCGCQNILIAREPREEDENE